MNVTQKQIAEMVDVPTSFFSRIINCKRPCPVAVADRLEILTGVGMRVWLLGSRDEKQIALRGYIRKLEDEEGKTEEKKA